MFWIMIICAPLLLGLLTPRAGSAFAWLWLAAAAGFALEWVGAACVFWVLSLIAALSAPQGAQRRGG